MRPACKNLEEIAQLDEETIRPCDVAGVLGMNPYAINLSFKLGRPMFEGFMVGRNVRIYRRKFLEKMGYKEIQE